MAEKKKHRGQCMPVDLCEDCVNYNQGWSQTAGHNAELRERIGILKQLAGEYYVAGKDREANLLRDIVRSWENDQAKLSDLLDSYINGTGGYGD